MKVLALAPGRRLHREQVINLVWPEDTIAEAVPKLHKAAHFARRALGVPDAVVLRGNQVVLCPGGGVTVDAVRFGELARRALAAGDAAAAGEALALYGGELLPADRYEEWAEARSRAAQAVSPGPAAPGRPLGGGGRARPGRRARPPRPHAAARGQRRPARRAAPVRPPGPGAAAGLGVAPARRLRRSGTACSPRTTCSRTATARWSAAIMETSIAERALLDAAAGGNRTLVISGEAGAGKSSLLAAIAARRRSWVWQSVTEPRPRSRGRGRMPRSSRRSSACAGGPGLLSGLAVP